MDKKVVKRLIELNQALHNAVYLPGIEAVSVMNNIHWEANSIAAKAGITGEMLRDPEGEYAEVEWWICQTPKTHPQLIHFLETGDKDYDDRNNGIITASDWGAITSPKIEATQALAWPLIYRLGGKTCKTIAVNRKQLKLAWDFYKGHVKIVEDDPNNDNVIVSCIDRGGED